MRMGRVGLLVYWPAVAGLVSMIGSGVSADANISRDAPSVATNPVAQTAFAPAPAAAVEPISLTPLADGQPGDGDAGLVHVADQVGIASWYGSQNQGRLTASGERFDQHKLTAAHRTLPLDTKVKVTNLENGKSIEVKVNDRGPYIPGRVLDLSTQAAKLLGMEKEGLALVRIEILPSQQVAAVD
jgi:rare lipoprotein A